MLNKVISAVNSFCLLYGVKTVAVAVSGGADSVALLDAFLKIKDEYGIEVFAAHFNHRIRGSESDADEEFVRSLCKDKGIKIVVGSGDVLSYSKEHKLSTELAARKLRYSFFETLPADAVATAHTASDNLETVIFNLTRGSALDGLCGIPPKRDKYIRPLILCTRENVEEYCKNNCLEFVTDSTNLCDDYSRNRIRHKVVPVLKDINPAVENNVVNTALSLAFDRDKLNSIAKTKYLNMLTNKGLDVTALTDDGRAVSGRILRMFCEEKTGISPDYIHTEELLGVAVNGGKCSLPGGYFAYKQKNILKIANNGDVPSFDVKIEKQKSPLIKKNKKVNNLLLKNLIDCDKIVGDLKIRTRKEGDKICLLGRGCTKTLKQLYNENSVPLEARKTLPVIADNLGVVWIAGIGVAARVAVDFDTDFVYKISY